MVFFEPFGIVQITRIIVVLYPYLDIVHDILVDSVTPLASLIVTSLKFSEGD